VQDLTAAGSSGVFPAVAFDPGTGAVFATSQDPSRNEKAGYFRCTPSGIAATPYACCFHDLSALNAGGDGASSTPTLAVSGGKVHYVTMNKSRGYFPWLFRCDAAGIAAPGCGQATCESIDWSGSNRPVNDSGYFPVALPHAGRLHVVSHWVDQSNPRKFVPALVTGEL
jgi:hypothetical protein